jgi:hypothetical protein
MNSSFDDYTFDNDLLQDMEEQLYNPLPDGLMERDWLELPEIERDWLELPEIERDWLELPTIERDWLNFPEIERGWDPSFSLNDAEREEPSLMPEDSPNFDLDL